MEIQHIPSLNPTQPLAILLAEDNLAATQAATNAALAGLFELTEKHATADELTTYMTPARAVFVLGLGKLGGISVEKVRAAICKAVARANEQKFAALQIALVGLDAHPHAELLAIALGEVPALANYQYFPFKKDREKLTNTLKAVHIVTDAPNATALIAHGSNNAVAVNHARDLVNDPPNVLTATELASRAYNFGKQYGFKATVHDKKWIEGEKMGGLLGVNLGSPQPPTFTVLEHKPAEAKNAKPIVLVGKGVTFDTGGLSLKPAASMDTMKCDMAGAAAVIGTFISLALNKIPVHVIGLIPSTDNRPGEDAYTPNDVLTMHDGTTVEVRNTDAEGRLILADALSYAKNYKPELVIDLATLTGAAVVAVGSAGMPMMATADDATIQQLEAAGEAVYERTVRFPLWDEYAEMIKSDIADLKNIGGKEAGSITAAKFLQHFTDYPWVHLDIAGPAFLEAGKSYRPKNGTGWGIRLLVQYIRTLA